MLRVADARRRLDRDLGRVRAAQRGDHAGDDDRQRVAAGVDDAALAQDRQQVGAALDGRLAGAQRALEDVGDERVLHRGVALGAQPRVAHVRDLGRHARRHVAQDGEDRALGRLAHRAVRALRGARHRGADEDRVDELAGAADELLGGAADELREDDAAVAAGAEQGRAGDGLDDLVAADLVDEATSPCERVRREPVELGEHGLQRERHVVAGVAVGDREDVEVVDLAAARLEVRERAVDDGAEADEAGVRHEATTPAEARRYTASDGQPVYRAFVTFPAFRQRVQT